MKNTTDSKPQPPRRLRAVICYAATEVYQDRFKTGTQVDLILPLKNPHSAKPLRVHAIYMAGDKHYERAKAHAKELGGKKVPLYAA